jgi:hypothetical protein
LTGENAINSLEFFHKFEYARGWYSLETAFTILGYIVIYWFKVVMPLLIGWKMANDGDKRFIACLQVYAIFASIFAVLCASLLGETPLSLDTLTTTFYEKDFEVSIGKRFLVGTKVFLYFMGLQLIGWFIGQIGLRRHKAKQRRSIQ